MNNHQNPKNQTKKVFTREQKELDLKNKLLESPELFIKDKNTDEYLDRLALKIKLIGGDELWLSDFVAEAVSKYERRFSKQWFYKLADLYRVDRSVMDKYVKPEFVRKFIIQFVYGRFPFSVLKTLRSRNRKTSCESNRTKLFQHLTESAVSQLEIVIDQIYSMMCQYNNPLEFKMNYSKEFKIYFQLELEF